MDIATDTLHTLAAGFASEDEAERRQAAADLETLLDQDQDAVLRELIAALDRDRDPRRRLGYARALAATRHPAALYLLSGYLDREPDSGVWQAIRRQLDTLAGPAAWYALKAAAGLLVRHRQRPGAYWSAFLAPASLADYALSNPTVRAVLEAAVNTAPLHGQRRDAAITLLGLARTTGRAVPADTWRRLTGALGVSELYSEQAREVLEARAGGESREALLAGRLNPDSERYARPVLDKADPGGDWRRTLFPRIELPRYCPLEQPVLLSVQLVMDGATHPLPVQVRFREGETRVPVKVLITSADFHVDSPWRTLTVPAVGDSDVALFTVLPRHEGRGRLAVEFFREGRRIGLVVVRAFAHAGEWTCDEETDRWLRQQVVSLEDPGRGLAELPQGRALVARVKSAANPGDHVEWYDPIELDPRAKPSLEPVDWQNAESYFETFRRDLGEALERAHRLAPAADATDRPPGNDPGYRQYLDYLEFMDLELQSVGAVLYDKVVAPEIRQTVAALEPGTPLHFSTDEKLAWMPWELVYDRHTGEFWGERYCVGRLATPATDPKGHRPEQAEAGSRQVVHVAGDGLVAGSHYLNALIGRLQTLFRGLPVAGNVTLPFHELTVQDFTREAAGGDIVHLTCVGERDRSSVYYLRLGPDLIHHLKLRHLAILNLKPRALVFTNACSTTSASLLLNEYSNFAWEVYQHGAGAFVGTLAPVPTEEAIGFAETLYRHLLPGQLTLGEALRRTKTEFARRQPRHPFFRLYCLYGDTGWRWG